MKPTLENRKQEAIAVLTGILQKINMSPEISAEILTQIEELNERICAIEAASSVWDLPPDSNRVQATASPQAGSALSATEAQNSDEKPEPFSSACHAGGQNFPTCSTFPDKPEVKFSEKLSGLIQKVKMGEFPAVPLNENLEKSIKAKDRTRTIGLMVVDDLWGGTIPAESFYELASFIWKYAPEFFDVSFDADRVINEIESDWNLTYFNEQRNYLRHNFRLERLCHLIMVYDFLTNSRRISPQRPSTSPQKVFPDKATEGQSLSSPHAKGTQSSPFVTDSLSCPAGSKSQKNLRVGLASSLLFASSSWL